MMMMMRRRSRKKMKKNKKKEEEDNDDHLVILELMVDILNMTSWRWNTEEEDPISAGNHGPGGPGGDWTRVRHAGGSNWKVSGFPTVLVPAYSLLKQEQLQLAQASFRNHGKPSIQHLPSFSIIHVPYDNPHFGFDDYMISYRSHTKHQFEGLQKGPFCQRSCGSGWTTSASSASAAAENVHVASRILLWDADCLHGWNGAAGPWSALLSLERDEVSIAHWQINRVQKWPCHICRFEIKQTLSRIPNRQFSQQQYL